MDNKQTIDALNGIGEWLTVEEVAEECRATPRTVRDWIRGGHLASSKPRKRHLIRRRDLDEFLRK